MTYTVLVADPASAVVGVGTASKALAVGSLVPRIDHRVGAAASQGWTNALAVEVLQALVTGADVETSVAQAISYDDGREFRQVGVIDRAGRPAAYTGARCTPWAGHRSGPGHLVIGNLLAGPHVLDAADAAVRVVPDVPVPSRTLPFIDNAGRTEPLAVTLAVARVGLRIVAALQAAESAGGDVRGRQSTALLVRRTGARAASPLTELDLRVDDATDPLTELRRLLDLQLHGHFDESGATA